MRHEVRRGRRGYPIGGEPRMGDTANRRIGDRDESVTGAKGTLGGGRDKTYGTCASYVDALHIRPRVAPTRSIAHSPVRPFGFLPSKAKPRAKDAEYATNEKIESQLSIGSASVSSNSRVQICRSTPVTFRGVLCVRRARLFFGVRSTSGLLSEPGSFKVNPGVRSKLSYENYWDPSHA